MADTARCNLALPAILFRHQPKRDHTIGFKESLILGNHLPEFCGRGRAYPHSLVPKLFEWVVPHYALIVAALPHKLARKIRR
jgi:hypothetical protein